MKFHSRCSSSASYHTCLALPLHVCLAAEAQIEALVRPEWRPGQDKAESRMAGGEGNLATY